MTFVLDDRVRENSTTTGTGNITLTGAVSGYKSFSSRMSVADTCFYTIINGTEWEVGLGTYSASNTLTRTTVYRSSNADALVNFSAGTKDVFIDLPAFAGMDATGKTRFNNLNGAFGVHGADIASAATVNLEAATGDLVDVTGTTTITAITLSEGHERTVRFTGALTLTNGASLVLPGGANITTEASDIAIFRGYASSVVRCVSYSRIAPFATAAQMEAGTDATRSVTPSVQQYHQSAAKAWCKVDSAANNTASYNVSGVTDTGTGLVTVTWDTDFSTANYAVPAQALETSSSYLCNINSQAAGSVVIQAWQVGVGRVDMAQYYVAAFGDL